MSTLPATMFMLSTPERWFTFTSETTTFTARFTLLMAIVEAMICAAAVALVFAFTVSLPLPRFSVPVVVVPSAFSVPCTSAAIFAPVSATAMLVSRLPMATLTAGDVPTASALTFAMVFTVALPALMPVTPFTVASPPLISALNSPRALATSTFSAALAQATLIVGEATSASANESPLVSTVSAPVMLALLAANSDLTFAEMTAAVVLALTFTRLMEAPPPFSSSCSAAEPPTMVFAPALFAL